MNAMLDNLCAGLTDPVHDAQQAYRAALDALARPGRRMDVGRAIAGLPLGAAMAHLLLTLADDDTAVWWQDGGDTAARWLRFHTGARAAAVPDESALAVITSALAMPALDAFARGTLASPEFSSTLLLEVLSLDAGPLVHWHGPGIHGAQPVQIEGLAPGFWTQWQANHASFPQGVDVIFTCGAQALGLPRTIRVSRVERT
jgi:alpha-D-ribose 1-methylphosphonate 5-triphosphate synthase subunit PhnH